MPTIHPIVFEGRTIKNICEQIIFRGYQFGHNKRRIPHLMEMGDEIKGGYIARSWLSSKFKDIRARAAIVGLDNDRGQVNVGVGNYCGPQLLLFKVDYLGISVRHYRDIVLFPGWKGQRRINLYSSGRASPEGCSFHEEVITPIF